MGFQLGHAGIRTINDGRLRVREIGVVLAVVEAKPFRLLENSGPTLMYMGWGLWRTSSTATKKGTT